MNSVIKTNICPNCGAPMEESSVFLGDRDWHCSYCGTTVRTERWTTKSYIIESPKVRAFSVYQRSPIEILDYFGRNDMIQRMKEKICYDLVNQIMPYVSFDEDFEPGTNEFIIRGRLRFLDPTVLL